MTAAGVFNQDEMQQKEQVLIAPAHGRRVLLSAPRPPVAAKVIITEFPVYLSSGNNKDISTSFGKRYL
jgi:hypothetical protein